MQTYQDMFILEWWHCRNLLENAWKVPLKSLRSVHDSRQNGCNQNMFGQMRAKWRLAFSPTRIAPRSLTSKVLLSGSISCPLLAPIAFYRAKAVMCRRIFRRIHLSDCNTPIDSWNDRFQHLLAILQALRGALEDDVARYI